MILVEDPYFNEPGYESSRNTPSGKQQSNSYNANIRRATLEHAVLDTLKKPCAAFAEVIRYAALNAWHSASRVFADHWQNCEKTVLCMKRFLCEPYRAPHAGLY